MTSQLWARISAISGADGSGSKLVFAKNKSGAIRFEIAVEAQQVSAFYPGLRAVCVQFPAGPKPYKSTQARRSKHCGGRTIRQQAESARQDSVFGEKALNELGKTSRW